MSRRQLDRAQRERLMIFRTSYFVGIMACAMAVVSATHFIEPAHAETLKITGPNGEVSSAPTRQYGPTTSADTFWSIAQKVRPNQNISVYQVMAALFDANPHAFSSNNYNSLERGMTLLVPSADVMAQVSRSEAKTRAENNDKRLPNANQRATSTTPPAIPSTNNPPVANQPSPQKPLQIVAETKQPTATDLAKQAAAKSQPQIDELTVKLEDAQTKTLSLTDELARAEDMLMVKDADNTALKAKIQELTLQLSAMQEDFQLLTEKYQGLETTHQQLVEQNNKPEVVEEPTDFWRSISDNMMLLALVAALPLVIIFLLIFWLMRRKNNASNEAETSAEQEMEQEAFEPEAEVDDIENLAIHLDEDEASTDSIDDLLDLETTATEELSLDESPDADMYITEDDQTTEEEAEGTSLDDLWAEAMEEQEEDLQPLEADEDDLDSLLEGLDSPVESEDTAAEQETASDTDDLDSLLAGFDEPEPDSAASLDSSSESNIDATEDSNPQNDIDSLLADFDLPEETDSSDIQSLESDTPAADPQDDIDSLLAGFDIPAETDSEVLTTEDEPAAPELAAQVTEALATDTQDDIDSLLADFDLPDEISTDADLALEAEIETESASEQAETTSDEDDLDALLASIDAPTEDEHDFTAEIAAELENDVSVSLDETANIDELIAEVDPEKEFAPLSNEGLDVEQVLSAELEEIESELEIESDNGDINSLLSELESTGSETEKDEANFDTNTDFEIDNIIADIEQEQPEQFSSKLENTDNEAADLDELLADLDATDLDVTDSNETDLKFAPGDESSLDMQDDSPSELQSEKETEPQEDLLVTELLAAEQQDKVSQQSNEEQDSDIDELDALLADFDVDKIADEEVPLFSNDETLVPEQSFATELDSTQEDQEQTTVSEQEFDAMLSELSVADSEDSELNVELNVEEQPDTEIAAKDSGFFDDLKSKKSESPALDWEADLFQQASNHPAAEQTDSISNDDDSYQLVDDNLTVDEALAALDAQEGLTVSESTKTESEQSDSSAAPSEAILDTFEQENGFIDIDKLLNDADEDIDLSDQYKDVDVDMGEVNSLIGNAEMIDVDDEENSVNAKLDLARAYIEIEDEDAAKAILKEVQIDGNERQQTEAGKLLDNMS